MRTYVYFFFNCFVFIFFLGCTHFKVSQNENLKKLSTTVPIKIEITGDKNFSETIDYYYQSHQRTYERKQIAHERSEVTEFTIESQVIDYDKEQGRLHLNQKTTQKSGSLELNDMAFPELNESIDFVFSKNGNVIKAGNFPNNSIFFVPPLPLPQKEVLEGDTWEYIGTWYNSEQGLELRLNLVGILRSVYECYKHERCVELEYSGKIELPETLNSIAKFESRLEARFLLRLNNFSIINSEVKNHDIMERDGFLMDTKSCLVSRKRLKSDNKGPSCQI